eukprot:1137431-Pelagomonas_calceolata.AAC.9
MNIPFPDVKCWIVLDDKGAPNCCLNLLETDPGYCQPGQIVTHRRDLGGSAIHPWLTLMHSLTPLQRLTGPTKISKLHTPIGFHQQVSALHICEATATRAPVDDRQHCHSAAKEAEQHVHAQKCMHIMDACPSQYRSLEQGGHGPCVGRADGKELRAKR